MEYLHFDEKKLDESEFTPEKIADMYNRGYVFTRIDRGVMHQTRSVRVNLAQFEPTSENRRIIRKGETAGVSMTHHTIPYADYRWEIGKIAKDFYDKKAGGAFSANKVKELITTAHNFNTFLEFNIMDVKTDTDTPVGFAICFEIPDMVHYSYPFYDLEKVKTGSAPESLGLIMMNTVLVDAKARGCSYVYLGSLQRPTDTYKLQFEGLEWFDGKEWRTDTEEVKNILKK